VATALSVIGWGGGALTHALLLRLAASVWRWRCCRALLLQPIVGRQVQRRLYAGHQLPELGRDAVRVRWRLQEEGIREAAELARDALQLVGRRRHAVISDGRCVVSEMGCGGNNFAIAAEEGSDQASHQAGSAD
jgi:hypothetical protein